jgi:hypothetical protein
MCFLLYAGTSEPIPRRKWSQESPIISVNSLQGDEELIKAHFNKPEIQNIGSTSSCGCDFPSAMFQNGGWPEIEYSEKDEEQQAIEQFNREALVDLLRTLNEGWIELYGVWAGDYVAPPEAREEIPLQGLLDAHFCFKERALYKVHLHAQ